MVRISGYLFVFGLFVCSWFRTLFACPRTILLSVPFLKKIANNIFRLILQINNMFGCWL